MLISPSDLVCVCMPSHFSCVWLCATLWTVARQAPVSMGILQVRTLARVAMPSSRGSSWPNTEPTSPMSPALAHSLPLVPPLILASTLKPHKKTWNSSVAYVPPSGIVIQLVGSGAWTLVGFKAWSVPDGLRTTAWACKLLKMGIFPCYSWVYHRVWGTGAT